MKLGVLAHTFGKRPTAELAQIIADNGFNSVQLALAKALSDMDSANGKLSPGFANEVGEQFASRGVKIAVLGCYINPIDPDPVSRRADINRFKEHLRYARDFGCSMVATETGERTTYKDSHPDTYDAKSWSVLKDTLEEITEEAEKWGVHAAIEPVATHTLHTHEHMTRLFEEIPSSNLGMLFDPCNLIKQQHTADQGAFLREVMEKLYEKIIVIHAKDVAFNAQGEKYNPVPGAGILDYPLFFELLKTYKPHIDISLEGVNAEEAVPAAKHLRAVWDAVKVQ
ncbi:sugar phosphate isomerase/epimerase [Paenibacillus xylanexedens]|uniref:sugar phosphate isomerase/epimerase family protein n=1 Tax=Paenibacillus xylanexedens TaxID=528191 RepID=UPI0011A6718C|nr:sugar phosphate isomerase/epimerase [Paenibacillus xylanexedens]